MNEYGWSELFLPLPKLTLFPAKPFITNVNDLLFRMIQLIGRSNCFIWLS